MAFAKTVSYMENALEDGVYIFKVSEMHKTYQDYLQNLGIDIKTRLKTELLEHSQKSAVQEQCNVLLVFPDGMHEILQNAKLLLDYKSEAL